MIRENSPISRGISIIKESLITMPESAGVYRMLDEGGQVLYVGKAKNLKKRISSYSRIEGHSIRIQRMIARTSSMEVITTKTEAEALLLESDLIKKLKPYYNILLRDDKSFPYIVVTTKDEWPKIIKYRGSQNIKGKYFGPFASAGAVNSTLATLQKAFLLRSCTDSVFKNRSRPCLLHQIKRCSAPCVDKISKDEYKKLVTEATDFLSGKTSDVQKRLSALMEEASSRQEYEEAVLYRDRIQALSQVQMQQDLQQNLADADVIAFAQEEGVACIQVFFFRGNRNCGNKAFFPDKVRDASAAEVLDAFISQFYMRHCLPKEIVISHALEDADMISAALSQKAEYKFVLHTPKKGKRYTAVSNAILNAKEALKRHLSENATQQKLLEATAEAFGLDASPSRIEIYDNSHIQGAFAVGAMVVAGAEGFMKGAYRKFNIKHDEEHKGDDFYMMQEVFNRRFARAMKEDADNAKGTWPDVVIIDGGKGQLSSAREVMDELGISDDNVKLVAISKGSDRNAGKEQFHMTGKEAFPLPENSPVLYFLQRLRDEAHRFAIGSHRIRRTKAIFYSSLDEIKGIGAGRKKSLMHHFGSAKAVQEASLKDLEMVEGISKKIAENIYGYFHES
ncbi:MAG: excinuclease ABC subunit UvrC [Alphaproteobacteria bacterium]|nr:excinuclease ABC subunit UvrC [Alphaproteobacteria bacterium]